jgi:hypothetical protein
MAFLVFHRALELPANPATAICLEAIALV